MPIRNGSGACKKYNRDDGNKGMYTCCHLQKHTKQTHEVEDKVGGCDVCWNVPGRVAEEHERFGDGVIIKIEGSGTNCRAHIQFYKLGVKVLDLNIAKLERI